MLDKSPCEQALLPANGHQRQHVTDGQKQVVGPKWVQRCNAEGPGD